MKTEKNKPGDILYDEERKMLVKVARVDDDGVVKYSAITDMKRIFQTPPPPYRRGTRTADAYVPATDEQRKYMERHLAVCEYVNLPKNNRIEVLAYIIADLKAENMELEQRVQQLADDYNDVVRQLDGKEKRKDKNSKPTLGEVLDVRATCYKLEVENRELKRFAKAMQYFVKDKNLYMEKDKKCPYHPGGVSVCSTSCLECNLCLGVLDGIGVICEEKLRDPCVAPTTDD